MEETPPGRGYASCLVKSPDHPVGMEDQHVRVLTTPFLSHPYEAKIDQGAHPLPPTPNRASPSSHKPHGICALLFIDDLDETGRIEASGPQFKVDLRWIDSVGQRLRQSSDHRQGPGRREEAGQIPVGIRHLTGVGPEVVPDQFPAGACRCHVTFWLRSAISFSTPRWRINKMEDQQDSRQRLTHPKRSSRSRVEDRHRPNSTRTEASYSVSAA